MFLGYKDASAALSLPPLPLTRKIEAGGLPNT